MCQFYRRHKYVIKVIKFSNAHYHIYKHLFRKIWKSARRLWTTLTWRSQNSITPLHPHFLSEFDRRLCIYYVMHLRSCRPPFLPKHFLTPVSRRATWNNPKSSFIFVRSRRGCVFKQLATYPAHKRAGHYTTAAPKPSNAMPKQSSAGGEQQSARWVEVRRQVIVLGT